MIIYLFVKFFCLSKSNYYTVSFWFLKLQISEGIFLNKMVKLRKEVRLAEDIPERGEKMEEKMNEIEKAERRNERTR